MRDLPYFVGKDVTCSTCVFWSRPSRKARLFHISAVLQSTAEFTDTGRRAFAEAVHADTDLHGRDARIGKGVWQEIDAVLRSLGLWYAWAHCSLGMGPPLQAGSLDHTQHSYATGKKAQLQLAGARANLSVHVLGVINHARGQRRPKRHLATPEPCRQEVMVHPDTPSGLTERPHKEAT